MDAAAAVAVWLAPFEHEFCQFIGCRVRQSKRANLHISRMIFKAELLDRAERDFRILLEKAQELVFSDKIYLTLFQNYRCCFISRIGNRLAQSKNFASFGNAQNNNFTVSRTGRELNSSLAKHINAV